MITKTFCEIRDGRDHAAWNGYITLRKPTVRMCLIDFRYLNSDEMETEPFPFNSRFRASLHLKSLQRHRP
jgi:hypothetical protein